LLTNHQQDGFKSSFIQVFNRPKIDFFFQMAQRQREPRERNARQLMQNNLNDHAPTPYNQGLTQDTQQRQIQQTRYDTRQGQREQSMHLLHAQQRQIQALLPQIQPPTKEEVAQRRQLQMQRGLAQTQRQDQNRLLQRTHQQTLRSQQPPPPYAALVAGDPDNNQPCGSNTRRLSIESLAFQLNIPNLLKVSLADALELDFKNLSETCGITTVEFLRLKGYKLSIE
jgi:hypothetical protein